MYVFVDIRVDVRHLVATVQANFPPGTNLALAGTIQFGSSIQVCD
jgi:2-(3-amino-3-carboxypropyl)histidine synthase